MRHGYSGKKLSRTKNERRRLFMILTRSLFLHGSLKTTQAKAKAIQPLVEKLITKAKRADNASIARIRKVLADKISVDTLLNWAKVRFAARTSGFTRVVKLGVRVGDGGEQVLLSFVDEAPVTEVVKASKGTKVSKETKKIVEAEVVKKPKQPKSPKQLK